MWKERYVGERVMSEKEMCRKERKRSWRSKEENERWWREKEERGKGKRLERQIIRYGHAREKEQGK